MMKSFATRDPNLYGSSFVHTANIIKLVGISNIGIEPNLRVMHGSFI